MCMLPQHICKSWQFWPSEAALSAEMVCKRRVSLDVMQAISNVGLLGILGLKAVGYCAFRGANSQKDTFRNDPDHPSVKHLQTLKTERGTQLITSGWWGVARHINYTGDWLMA